MSKQVKFNANLHKVELQVVQLNTNSLDRAMDALRTIHGEDFELDNPNKYKDLRGNVDWRYWKDRGKLIVEQAHNFGGDNNNNPQHRFDEFAMKLLESYGFATKHCKEVYEYCEGDTTAALYFLYRKYMRIPDKAEEIDLERNGGGLLPGQTLQEMRADEKVVLKSVYDGAFIEKETDRLWAVYVPDTSGYKWEKVPAKTHHEKSQTHTGIAEGSSADGGALEANVLPEDKKAQPTNKQPEPKECRYFKRLGKCPYSVRCLFTHKKPECTIKAKDGEKENMPNEFIVEVHIPEGSKYPFEAPYILVKSTRPNAHPPRRLLCIAHHLYQTALELAKDGISSVYNICEMLQDKLAMHELQMKFDSLCSSDSIFLEDSKELSTHYQLGETSHGAEGASRLDITALAQMNCKLARNFFNKQRQENYKRMLDVRRTLPAYVQAADILAKIKQHQVVIILGETGCGKTTQVPQIILDDWLSSIDPCKPNAPIRNIELVCTQPRRLAAIGVAERVANERCDSVGQTVGYHIRFEKRTSPRTRLTYCTTGILLRRLAGDPLLASTTHLFIDEAHERQEELDFLLLALKRVLMQRTDLKVVLMSATMKADTIIEYFGGAPTIDIPGRTFPVEQYFLEDIIELTGYAVEMGTKACRHLSPDDIKVLDIGAQSCAKPSEKREDSRLSLSELNARYETYSDLTCRTIYKLREMTVNVDLIVAALNYILLGDHEWPSEGSILVFLPGLQDIKDVHNELRGSTIGEDPNILLLPLHSTLTNEEQANIFKPTPAGKRKIILSTNIAETSITIDDCVFVIDCGLMKEKNFDAQRNIESLDLVQISRANAMQRKGRAGRVRPGICIHLFTSFRYRNEFKSQPIAEIHRVPLEQTLLRLKINKMFAHEHPVEVLKQAPEPPDVENVENAAKRLVYLDAMTDNYELTPLGYHLAALPVDVRIGKLMLYGAIFQCVDSVLTIASCLSLGSIFARPFDKSIEAEEKQKRFDVYNSDHLAWLTAYNEWLKCNKKGAFAGQRFAEENYLSLKGMRNLAESKHQYLELLVEQGFVPVNVPRRRRNDPDRIYELTGAELNINSNNYPLLVGLLCASLYPNIAQIATATPKFKEIMGGTVSAEYKIEEIYFLVNPNSTVRVHPSSVNAKRTVFRSPYLLYQEMTRTKCLYIRDCSLLTSMALVLFAGGDFKLELHHGEFFFLLEGGWNVLKVKDYKTAEIIRCFRAELTNVLKNKIADPCLNLLNCKKSRKLIEALVYIITNNI